MAEKGGEVQNFLLVEMYLQCQVICFLVFIFFLSFSYSIIVVLGVHCDIYEMSYNVSLLNLPLSSFSFIPPAPIMK
jgi:hypothetical protein